MVVYVEITLSTVSDIPRILEIRHAAFSAHALSAYSEQEVQTLLNDVDESELADMARNDQLFVACFEGAVIGVAGWKDDRIRHVYIDPEHTRRGVGTALLRYAESDYRHRTKATHVKAGVGLQAEGFYAANGYSILSRARASDDSEFLWMIKSV